MWHILWPCLDNLLDKFLVDCLFFSKDLAKIIFDIFVCTVGLPDLLRSSRDSPPSYFFHHLQTKLLSTARALPTSIHVFPALIIPMAWCRRLILACPLFPDIDIWARTYVWCCLYNLQYNNENLCLQLKTSS